MAKCAGRNLREEEASKGTVAVKEEVRLSILLSSLLPLFCCSPSFSPRFVGWYPFSRSKRSSILALGTSIPYLE